MFGLVELRVMLHEMELKNDYSVNPEWLTSLDQVLSREIASLETLRLRVQQHMQSTQLSLSTYLALLVRCNSKLINRIARIGKDQPESSSGSTKNRLKKSTPKD